MAFLAVHKVIISSACPSLSIFESGLPSILATDYVSSLFSEPLGFSSPTRNLILLSDTAWRSLASLNCANSSAARFRHQGSVSPAYSMLQYRLISVVPPTSVCELTIDDFEQYVLRQGFLNGMSHHDLLSSLISFVRQNMTPSVFASTTRFVSIPTLRASKRSPCSLAHPCTRSASTSTVSMTVLLVLAVFVFEVASWRGFRSRYFMWLQSGRLGYNLLVATGSSSHDNKNLAYTDLEFAQGARVYVSYVCPFWPARACDEVNIIKRKSLCHSTGN